MCQLDRNGGGILVNQNYGRGMTEKNLLSQLEFQEAVNEPKKAGFIKKKRMIFSKRWDPLIQHSIASQQTNSSATLLSELKSHIYRTKQELQRCLNYLM
jgi:hypothetical protein